MNTLKRFSITALLALTMLLMLYASWQFTAPKKSKNTKLHNNHIDYATWISQQKPISTNFFW